MKEYIVSVLSYDGHRGYFVGESGTTTINGRHVVQGGVLVKYQEGAANA